MVKLTIVAAAALALGLQGTASAAVIDLTFEGINATYPTTTSAAIQNFYNGGTSSVGTSGTDYGISFPSNALAVCLNTIGNVCSSTSRGGLGDPNSQRGALFFRTGSSTFLDDAAGFTTGFSFNYAARLGGAIQVYSGLDGAGTLLATLTLPTTPSSCDGAYNAGFCPFVSSGVTFAGTAESIDFGGVANEITFDDVTFGRATPGPVPTVPEPATIAILGTAIAGLAAARRRARSTQA